MKRRLMPVLAAFCIAALGMAVPLAAAGDTTSLGEVKLSYKLNSFFRLASNQLAVWIEDENGKLVRTLFATNFMAKRRGFEKRAQCCPQWVNAADPKRMSDSELDAIAGATQKAGEHTLVWDCSDGNGRPVPAGVYLYKIEGNIHWEKTQLWTGRIRVGDAADRSEAAVKYFPEPAKAKEDLVTGVQAVFVPFRK
jgi:hypothetical protein